MDDSGSDGEENPLIKAAKACDLHALRRAIAEGCDVNYRDPDNGGYSHQQGWSALHHLCSSTYDSEPKQQRLACVAALIRAGADVNQRANHPEWPSPPIVLAARFCGAEVVRALIDAGADVNAALPENSGAPGLTPLHTAAIFNCAENVLLLIAAGAVVDAISQTHGPGPGLGPESDGPIPETPLDAATRFSVNSLFAGDFTRTYARLLRAGARIPTLPQPLMPPYLTAVAAAGGFARYERAHRTRLADIFIPKFPQLPKEIVHHIVSIWADVGGHY